MLPWPFSPSNFEVMHWGVMPFFGILIILWGFADLKNRVERIRDRGGLRTRISTQEKRFLSYTLIFIASGFLFVLLGVYTMVLGVVLAFLIGGIYLAIRIKRFVMGYICLIPEALRYIRREPISKS